MILRLRIRKSLPDAEVISVDLLTWAARILPLVTEVPRSREEVYLEVETLFQC